MSCRVKVDVIKIEVNDNQEIGTDEFLFLITNKTNTLLEVREDVPEGAVFPWTINVNKNIIDTVETSSVVDVLLFFDIRELDPVFTDYTLSPELNLSLISYPKPLTIDVQRRVVNLEESIDVTIFLIITLEEAI